MKKLNQAGLSHLIVVLVIIVVSAIAGTFFLVRSHAAVPRDSGSATLDCSGQVLSRYRTNNKNCVYSLQTLLSLNHVPTTRDGSFGPNTDRSVRTFQSSTGILKPDGAVGPLTWRFLCQKKMVGPYSSVQSADINRVCPHI